jgi:hypothetical protein
VYSLHLEQVGDVLFERPTKAHTSLPPSTEALRGDRVRLPSTGRLARLELRYMSLLQHQTFHSNHFLASCHLVLKIVVTAMAKPRGVRWSHTPKPSGIAKTATTTNAAPPCIFIPRAERWRAHQALRAGHMLHSNSAKDVVPDPRIPITSLESAILRLPKELRLTIYETVFPPAASPSPIALEGVETPSKALLLTCRTIYNEARTIYNSIIERSGQRVASVLL